MAKVINTILNLQDNMSKGLLRAAKNTKGVSDEMMRSTRRVVSMKNKVSDMASTAVKRLGQVGVAGAGAFAAFSLKTGMDFEAQMSRVQAISGASATELARLTDKAKEMGASTKFSATESAEAMEYMAMAGWKTDQMVAGLPGIMHLAAASGEELGTVSDIVTDALTAFGLKAEDSAHFADVLAKASSSASTNVAMMGATFQYAAPVAGALGYSVEDTAVAIGLMANAGIEGEKAGTALRGMLTNLAKPSKDVLGYTKELGVSLTTADGAVKPLSQQLGELRRKFAGLSEAQKAEYAAGIAGKEAMSALLAIVNASDADFNSLTEQIANADGAAQSMAETAQRNLKGQLEQLGGAVETVGLTFYDAIKGEATGALEALNAKLDEWNADGTITRMAQAVSQGVTAMVTQGKQAVSWLVANKETVLGVMKALAIGFAGSKILSFAGNTVRTAHDLALFGKTVGRVASANLPKFMDGLRGAVGSLGSFAAKAFSLVASNPVILFVAGAVAAGILIWKNWDTIKEKAGALWSKITETFGGIRDSITGAFDAAKEKVSGFFSWLDEKVTNIPVVGNIYSGVKGAIGWVGDKLGIGGNALGTSYWGGGLTRVNERGGEILDLPSGTRIIPHDVSRRAAGGNTVNIHLTVQGNLIGNRQYADEMGEIIVGRVLTALDNL